MTGKLGANLIRPRQALGRRPQSDLALALRVLASSNARPDWVQLSEINFTMQVKETIQATVEATPRLN